LINPNPTQPSIYTNTSTTVALKLPFSIMASKSLRPSAQPLNFQILNNNQGDFCNEEVLARLVHFWEARNFKKGNILMGVELLFLDSESNAVQAFISANRLYRYEDKLKSSSVYKLKKFMIKPCKTLYKVTDHAKAICFTDHTTMVEVSEGEQEIDEQKFRLRTFNDFSAIADMETDLFDVIGQLRLISGDNLHSVTANATAPEVLGNRSKDRVFLHLLMRELGDGRDNIAEVTSSSAAITKLETVSLNEIYQFIKTETPQVASFFCYCTIVDVPEQAGWCYISCKCKSKLGKSKVSLYCTTCKQTNNIGLIRYRFEISVRDENNDAATFVLFDPDVMKLLGRSANDVLNENIQVGGDATNTNIPECLKKIIGRTCKFQIKITSFNFETSRQIITVSRIVEDNVDLKTKLVEDNLNGDNDEGKIEATSPDDQVVFNGENKNKRPRH
ncbi:unnamed protein product, partial [Thlaspi arvense]